MTVLYFFIGKGNVKVTIRQLIFPDKCSLAGNTDYENAQNETKFSANDNQFVVQFVLLLNSSILH